MEGHDPSSRQQYAPTTYAAQPTQQTNAQVSSQYAAQGSAERFRHSYSLQQSPTAPSSLGRVGSDAQQVYAFPQSAQYGSMPAMQQSSMQYTQSFQTQDPQRQTQQASYQQYGAGVMYGSMAQPQSQQQQQQAAPSAYEQTGGYRQRPSSNSETLAAGFGVPQTATQYYLASQGVATSAPATDLAAQQLSSSYQQSAYQQPAQSTQQSYASAMIDTAQSGAYASYGQQAQYGNQQAAPTVDQAFNDYQSQVRSIFTLVRDGQLRDIGPHLLHISSYLLGHAEALGTSCLVYLTLLVHR
jgi:hypothetical protein